MGNANFKNQQTVSSGYYPSPWPGEDGGPERQQIPTGIRGLNIQPGDELKTVCRRLLVGNMVLLRAPGEVYLMHHDGLRKNFGFHSHSYVEKIDPETLKTVKKSPQLAGGPFWPVLFPAPLHMVGEFGIGRER